MASVDDYGYVLTGGLQRRYPVLIQYHRLVVRGAVLSSVTGGGGGDGGGFGHQEAAEGRGAADDDGGHEERHVRVSRARVTYATSGAGGACRGARGRWCGPAGENTPENRPNGFPGDEKSDGGWAAAGGRRGSLLRTATVGTDAKSFCRDVVTATPVQSREEQTTRGRGRKDEK